MPKVEKVLHGDVEQIAEKIACGVTSFGSLITKRAEWTTKTEAVTCILQVYEKQALEAHKPHFTMSLVLLDTGEEIRLHATTSGGFNEYFLTPYPDVEGELTSVLNTILNALDDIIL